MKIIVDAFGGDNAPLEILKGCALAVEEYGVSILLCGREDAIRKCALENGISLSGMEIAPAEEVISMHDSPGEIMKSKSGSSMAEGLRRLASGEGDAFVSAGSTGALVVGSTFLVKRIKGIKRPALAALIPADSGPYMLVDTGANAECRPEMLLQFGIMGSVYMNKVMGLASPRVGLLNIGTEETKGGPLQLESYRLLSAAPLHFIGNVEAREVPAGACDVLVADGFTGNVLLKLTEGMGLTFMKNLKTIFKKNTITKLSTLPMKDGLSDFKKKMDYTEHGGAPLMGIAKPVIKAHGSSNAKAFKNAIRQAKAFAETGVTGEIESKLQLLQQGDEQ